MVTAVDVAAVVHVVAFPDNAPLNIEHVNVDVDGLYVNGVVVLSTNKAEDDVTVLLNVI